MCKLKDFIRKWRICKDRRHAENVRRRADEIFTVGEYKGKMWYFCNNIGIFPCSFVGTNTENDIIEFLNDMRKFYIETE